MEQGRDRGGIRRLPAEGGRGRPESGTGRHWADQFTEDATYIEHHYGTFDGRQAIHEWISACMADYPGRDMPEFPIEWYVIDEERGLGGVPGLEPDEGPR